MPATAGAVTAGAVTAGAVALEVGVAVGPDWEVPDADGVAAPADEVAELVAARPGSVAVTEDAWPPGGAVG